MTDNDIRNAVLAAYMRKYPDWRRVDISAVTEAASGGFLVVVSARDEEKDEVEEVCFVDRKLHVRIFDATGELVTYLENLGSLRRWIFSGQGVSAIAFFILLLAVIAFTFWPSLVTNDKAFEVLRQMFVLAAGFFFGNQARREAS